MEWNDSALAGKGGKISSAGERVWALRCHK